MRSSLATQRAAAPRRVIAPVVLGCCPDTPRCKLCNPPPPAPEPETVSALLAHYQSERARPEDEVLVGFFGGAPPDDRLLDAIDGAPFAARVRPDLLSRADADRLVRRGLQAVELDALTFDDLVLRSIDRRYRSALVREQIAGLRALGLKVGVVLAPGLPNTDFAGAMQDAHLAADLVDFARLHPVLVLDRAGLREAHLDGRYQPLDLGEAVTVCRAMLEVLEPAGVEVIRVGQQPRPDGLGRAVAGPAHPSLRELVEARRSLDQIRAGLDERAAGTHIVIRCAPADEARTRGPRNDNLRALRAEFSLASLRITSDPSLSRGEWHIDRNGDRGSSRLSDRGSSRVENE